MLFQPLYEKDTTDLQVRVKGLYQAATREPVAPGNRHNRVRAQLTRLSLKHLRLGEEVRYLSYAKVIKGPGAPVGVLAWRTFGPVWFASLGYGRCPRSDIRPTQCA